MNFRMNSKLKISALSFILFSSIFSTLAAVKIPTPTHVMDPDDLLSSSVEERIKNELKNFYNTTKATMFVLVINSLEGESIEGFSIRAIDTWGAQAPGDKQRDDGLLLTIAIQDRQLRLEVGQGLEGKITDGIAGELIRAVSNKLQSQNYEGAIKQIISDSAKIIAGNYTPQNKKSNKHLNSDNYRIIIFIIIFILIAFLNNRHGGRGFRSTRRGGFSFGGGGSSGGGFGRSGGGFSGGGASGRW